jgi:hypothetical protein
MQPLRPVGVTWRKPTPEITAGTLWLAAGMLSVGALAGAQASTPTQPPQRARAAAPIPRPHAAASTPGASAAASAAWSAPATLAWCPAASHPLVVFPSDSPRHATGPGAILWSVPQTGVRSVPQIGVRSMPQTGCAGPAGIWVAPTGHDAQPGQPIPSAAPREAVLGITSLQAAAAAPQGKIVVVGSNDASSGASAPEREPGSFSEGIAGQPFAKPVATGGPAAPVAATTGYLGDVAIASLGGPGAGGDRARGEALQVRMERHYDKTFGAPITALDEGTGTRQIALALDFRGEALLAWRRDDAIYAVALSNKGLPGAIQRLGSAGPDAQLAALNSDDRRGTIAWSSDQAGMCSVFADVSAPSGRYGPPQLLERFAVPSGQPPGPGSLRLVRLADESVMIAWTGAQSGRYAVRVASVGQRGVRRPLTISTSGEDAILEDLVAGPGNEVLALWSVTGPAEPVAREPVAGKPGTGGPVAGKPGTGGPVAGEPGAGQPDTPHGAILAARGVERTPGVPTFDSPEEVAGGALAQSVSAAFDPESDRALAAWSEGGAIRYAIRGPGPGGGIVAAAGSRRAQGRSETAWRSAVIVALGICLLAILACVARRRFRLHDSAA